MHRLALGALLSLLLVVPAALAQEVQPSLWLEPARSGLADASGHGNDARLEPGAAIVDGAFQGNVSTTVRNETPKNITIVVEFRATRPGGKIVGFEDRQNGTSSNFDRQVWIADDGRLRFGVWAGGEESVASDARVDDGAWHTAVATVATNGARSRVALVVDGSAENATDATPPLLYTGWWRLGNGQFSSWRNAPRDPVFGGQTRLVRIYADAYSAARLGLGAPAKLTASSSLDAGALVVDLRASGLPAGARIVAIDPDGNESAVDASMRWRSDPAAGGRYRFEARVQGEVVASTSLLVLPPQASVAAMTVAVAAGAGVAAAQGFDVFSFLKRYFEGAAEDKWKERTKRFATPRLRSVAAAAIGIVLMALLVAAGKPGSLSRDAFLAALAVAGAATLLFKAVTIGGGALLARSQGQAARYQLWSAGALSLAVSSVLLHAPFGYTGYLEREGEARPVAKARAALGSLGLTLALAPLFLGIGLLTRFAFAEAGLAMCLGAVALGAMPFPRVQGHAVWLWSRPAAVALALGGLAPYVLFEEGLLPAGVIVALGLAGLVAFVVAAALGAKEKRMEPPRSAAARAGP